MADTRDILEEQCLTILRCQSLVWAIDKSTDDITAGEAVDYDTLNRTGALLSILEQLLATAMEQNQAGIGGQANG